jgi:UDP-glucose 4-epimerase
VDIEDVVSAHLLALDKAEAIGFDKYIISATTPFTKDDLADLRADAPAVLKRKAPEFEALYAARGWRMFPEIERVYVNERARTHLGWRPKYDFDHVLRSLRENTDVRSPLAQRIGSKAYHSRSFAEGPYPVE